MKPTSLRVQLVDRPSLDATVRFDFTDDRHTIRRGFSIGAPELLGDLGSVAPEYGYRTISFPLSIMSDEAFALRRQVELARELQRDESYLMVQLSDSSAPVWYRCVRSSPGLMDLGELFIDEVSQLWVFNVSLVAEAMGRGEEVTHSLTITNDPATGGLVTVLPDIQGDSPAPVHLVVEGGWNTAVAIGGVTRWDGLQSWQETSFSGGSVTANASASGGNVRAFTPTDTYATAFSAAVTPPQAGRYRLFARVGFSNSVGASGSPVIRAGGAAFADDARAIELTDAGLYYVDLGLFSFPSGNMPLSSDYVLAPPVAPTLVIEAKQTGSGRTLLLDVVVAVPVALFEQVDNTIATVAGGGETLVLDGDLERLVTMVDGELSNATDVGSGWTPSLTGGFPRVFPGVTNVMHLLRLNAPDVSGSVAATLTFSPRFLYLPGS